MDTQVNNPPPLDTDLASVDTSMPLLAESVYDLRIDKVEIVKTKDQKADMIKLEMKSTAPATDVKGLPLSAGITVFTNIMTSPTGKGTWDMVKRNLGAIVQAANLQGATLQNIPQWTQQLQGRVVRAKVLYVPEGVGKDGKSYRAKNEIAMFLKS